MRRLRRMRETTVPTGKTMHKIAIVASLRKREAPRVVADVVRWLEGRGLEVRLQRKVAEHLGRPELGESDESLMREASLALAMGGDGTMLATARLAAPSGIPILGCNLGGFGFLTELPESELMAALPCVLEGKCEVRERLMLEGEVMRGSQVAQRFLGLNDMVITQGALSRLLRLEIEVGGEQLGAFSADGVIVSTPTGSTAYSLSAGGPVMSPHVEALLVTPICAHTLSTRPMVVPSSAEIEVRAHPLQPEQEVMVTIDGQEGFPLQAQDVVRLRKARVTAHLVHLSGPSFFVKVRTKLGWASRS